ncbi:MAG TPA: methyltransferase domain-containing protein [Nitrospiria bacterium]
MHNHETVPSSLLKEFLSLLPKGKALDIAMGEGRNSLFLASQGFEVDGLERNPHAIEVCRHLALEKNLSVNTQQVNLEKTTLPSNDYNVVICFFYLQRNLIPQMKSALKKGGVLVYETFLIDQHLRHGIPKNREYCFEHNELLGLFVDFRILFYREGLPDEQPIRVSLIAQKIF